MGLSAPGGSSAQPAATGANAHRWRRWHTVLLCFLGIAGIGVGIWQAAAKGYLTRPVTSWLSAQLGRKLVVDGGLRVEVGRVTRLRATGLRLANVPWGGRRDMLLARSVVIEIDTRSLLRDTVIVRRLTVEALDLLLERNASGQNNWTFALHRNGSATALPLVIDAASLPGAKIRLTGPRLERPLDVVLDTVEQREQADGMLNLSASGQANATPIELRMSVGPFSNLVAAREFKVQAEGHLGEIALGVNGHVDSLESPVNTEASLSLKAPDAAYLAARLGLRNLGAGPVALNLAIAPATTGAGVQGRVSGQIGEFEVAAQGSLTEQSGISEIAVNAHVAGPDLSRVGGLAGVKGLPAEPFRLQLNVARTDDAIRIQSADLDLADGHVMLSGFLGPGGGLAGSELAFSASTPDITRIEKRLGVATAANGPFEAAGTVHHGKPGETRLQVNGTTNLGKFALAGPIGPHPDYYGTRMEVDVSGTNFTPLGRALKLADPPTGAFSGKGSVEWGRAGFVLRGASFRADGETLTLDGPLGRPAFARGADLRFELSGPNAARLAERFDLKGLPAAGYRVGGRIQRQNNRSVISDIKATVAGATVQLDGTVGDSPSWAGTNVSFEASGPNLAEFGGLLADLTPPRSAFSIAGQLGVAAGLAIRLNNVQATVADSQGIFSADFALPLDSAPLRFKLDATVPDPTRLLPSVGGTANLGKKLVISVVGARLKDQWSFERLRLASDNGLISAQGALVVAPHMIAKDVQLELRTASLRRTGLPSGQDWPDQPLELHARFSRTEKDMTLEALSGRLGASDFSGRIAARGLDDKPDLDVQLGFGQLDLDPYRSRATDALATAPSLAPVKSVRNRNSPVIPDEALRLPNLNAFTGKLALRAQSVRVWQQDFRDLQLQATLRDGRLQVDPLAVTGVAGQINVRGLLAARDKGVLAQFSGTGKNLTLRPIPISFGGPNASRFTAQVELQGSGSSLRALAGTLNGQVRLIGSGGRVVNSRLMASSNAFLTQLLTSLNPLATRRPTTEVVCAVYLLKARDGVVTTDPALVMRTAEIDIVANGSVDLRTEKIDFSFKTAARKGLGISVTQLINPYLKVTGTLGSPGVTLDPTGTLVNGGAAFATAGLSIVATTLWDRMVNEKDPCGAAVAEANRRTGN